MIQIHELWTTHNWENASQEEVIQALFHAPSFPNPFDVSAIQKFHPGAKAKYLNLFYQGEIPKSIKSLHKLQ